MTWLGVRRKQLPSNWGALRKARLELDGYRCTATHVITESRYGTSYVVQEQRCTDRATEVHHAVHRDDHRLSSLRSVCAYHHNLETQAEAQAAKPSRKRPVVQHPGLR